MSRLWRAYTGAVEAFCCAGIAVILVVGVLQVFFRYVMQSSLYWSEELMRYVMLWIVALGAGVSFSRGQFLGMRLVVEALPDWLRRVADVVAALLMLVFLGFIIWFGAKLSWGTRLQMATALSISMLWIHVSIVACAVVLAVHVALNELFGFGRERPGDVHDAGDRL